jgi:type IV pilus assembly protein PilY1
MGNYGAGLGITSGSAGNRGLDLSSQGLNIMSNGSSLTPIDLGMYLLDGYSEMTTSQVNSRKEKIVEWIQGGTVQNPRSEMGAPIHSSPVMIAYKEDSGDLVSTVFMSTNEGYLHAIDTGEPSRGNPVQDKVNRGGKELFAFMPKEMLRQTALLEQNAVMQPDAPYLYGLDSTWTFWREGGENTTISENTSDHVYIYGGMRRGGRMVYALNVTSVYHGGSVAPKLLFAIGNPDGQGSTPVSGTPAGDVSNFDDIGQTWSVPRVRKILWKGGLRNVLLFGGGYDTKHDSKNYEGQDELGSQVYMVDAYTGELLWAKSTPSSITARLRPYDRTGDTLIDSFYAVDVQGRVLRFDLNNNQNDFVMHEIADLGGSGINNRKFYEEPSIALINNPKSGAIDIMIAVGSGYRPHPTDQSVQENFYMIFDRGAYAASPANPAAVITQSDVVLADIDNGISEDPNDAGSIYNVNGWYYAFNKSIGEKSLGVPLIFNGLVIFTSYVTKESESDTCTPVIGQTRLYVMDISGKGRADIFNGSGAFLEDVSPGLASDIQVITIDGKPVILNDKAIVKPSEDKICEFVDCRGRDLDRSSWSSKTTSANEGKF